MSPQMTTLGTIGVGVGSSISNRTKSSGIYRPEDNALMQNYRHQIDCYNHNAFILDDRYFFSNPTSKIRGIHFNTQGNRFYFLLIRPSTPSSVIFTFSTDKPWQFVNAAQVSYYIFSSDINFSGLFVSPDLYNFYVVNANSNLLIRYRIRATKTEFAGIFNDTNYQLVNTFNFSSGTSPRGLKMNPIGTKLFFIKGNSINSTIQQWSMETPYDTSNLTFEGEISLNPNLQYSGYEPDNDPRDIAFGNNGYNLYVTGLQYARIYQINLTTAYDILGGHTIMPNFLYQGYYKLGDKAPSSLFFKEDGLSFYVGGSYLPSAPAFPTGSTTFYAGITKYDLITN